MHWIIYLIKSSCVFSTQTPLQSRHKNDLQANCFSTFNFSNKTTEAHCIAKQWMFKGNNIIGNFIKRSTQQSLTTVLLDNIISVFSGFLNWITVHVCITFKALHFDGMFRFTRPNHKRTLKSFHWSQSDMIYFPDWISASIDFYEHPNNSTLISNTEYTAARCIANFG